MDLILAVGMYMERGMSTVIGNIRSVIIHWCDIPAYHVDSGSARTAPPPALVLPETSLLPFIGSN